MEVEKKGLTALSIGLAMAVAGVALVLIFITPWIILSMAVAVVASLGKGSLAALIGVATAFLGVLLFWRVPLIRYFTPTDRERAMNCEKPKEEERAGGSG